MPTLPKEFDGDAFMSYAHLDNIALVEGRKGWVANLHRALEVRVGQLRGRITIRDRHSVYVGSGWGLT